jgi:cholesterol transport system auxiliary component
MATRLERATSNRIRSPRAIRFLQGLTPVAILTLIVAAAGCGSSAPIRPDLFYSLDPAPLEQPTGSPMPATLLVNDLAARGFLGGRQIVFRTPEEPLRVQRYEDLLWQEPVPRAISRNLATAIRAAELFEFTLIPADRGRADYLLGGEVERFEHLPTTGPGQQPARVVGTLNLAVVSARDRRSIQDRRYNREVDVRGDTPDDMIDAFNRLAALLAADVVRDLRTLPRPVRPEGTP